MAPGANEERRVGFVIRSKEVVDEETGETCCHYQVVENRRKDGRDRQRVVAHLGKHPTVEDATAELRKRLRELEAKRGEHQEEADGYASAIERTYSAQLKKFHGGRIPTRNEDHRLAWPKPWATEKGRRYMRDFGRVEWKRSFLKKGQTYEAYSGYETFSSWVRLYWWHKKKAAELQARVDRLSAKLSKFEGLSASGPAGA
jgi:BMFP domain-containing protein YqiC